jgi:hypothetical protein
LFGLKKSLFKKLSFHFKEQAYPKKDNEICILKRKWIKKDNMACNDIETFTDVTLKGIF